MIARDSNRWRRVYETHKGQYILCNRLQSGKIAASLFEITDISDRGIHFTLVNPFVGTDGVPRDFQYTGLLFPVSDYLCGIAEQEFGDYEVLSMAIEQSPISVPEFQQGMMLTISVREGTKQIAANNILLHFQRSRIRDWRAALHRRRLGHLDEHEVPQAVIRNLRSIFDYARPSTLR